MKELLTELRNKVLYLRNTEELSAKGELILLHKLNAIEKQFAISGVSGMFSEEQMEQAWTDGCGCGESRSGFFNIENYR